MLALSLIYAASLTPPVGSPSGYTFRLLDTILIIRVIGLPAPPSWASIKEPAAPPLSFPQLARWIYRTVIENQPLHAPMPCR
jgi:hypothetical protein